MNAPSESLTALIITYNEAPNIERTLSRLRWIGTILVVDSGSTDETLRLIGALPQAKVVHRDFDNFADQCNYGLSLIDSDWVLSLDADYELSNALVEEIRSLPPDGADAYSANFVYRVAGWPLRGTILPPRTVLYRRGVARYRNIGHGHKVEIEGRTASLRGVIFHDDRKPLVRWLQSQLRYADKEAQYLLTTPTTELSTADRIRRMAWPAPILVPLFALLVKGGLLDGWAGWRYALERSLAETLIALQLLDRRAQSKGKDAALKDRAP